MSHLIDAITESTYLGMSFHERMIFHKVPGLSLAAVDDGCIQTRCFGFRDTNTKREITDDTLFQAASISKVLFAIAVFRLAEAGKIDLDEDIQAYTSSCFYKTFDNMKHKVTLRNLLSHTAGFNNGGFTGYLSGMDIPSVDQILKGEYPANNIPLFMKAMPNTTWMYSGGGYIFAQKVICDVLHMEFERIMQEWILLPLGMQCSTFEQPLNKLTHQNFACGYDTYNMKILNDFSIMPELAAAGLWSTPKELSLLGIELMKAAMGKSNFLSQKSMNAIMTKPLPGTATGVGLFFPDENPNGYFEHSGSNLGYVSDMWFQTNTKKGIIVMINSSVSVDFLFELGDRVKDVIGAKTNSH